VESCLVNFVLLYTVSDMNLRKISVCSHKNFVKRLQMAKFEVLFHFWMVLDMRSL